VDISYRGQNEKWLTCN